MEGKATFQVAGDGDGTDGDSSIGSNIPEQFRGTAADRHDMEVLGKKQVLRRNFRFVTMLGFASTVMVGWETLPVYLPYLMIDGGTPLLFWGIVVGSCGMMLVYMSLAEITSLCPTAGGQYHWVSELAPPRFQKCLSYAVGWLTMTGWQTYLAGLFFIDAIVIQGLIQFNNQGYVWKRWHGTLLAIAVNLFAVAWNTLLASRVPIVQGFSLVLHIGGLIAIVATLWATAPITNGRDALLSFQNNGNWPNAGISSMVGLIYPVGILIGYDCVVHMSEETHDASRTLPRAMMVGVPINSLLNLFMGVTLCFCSASPAEWLETESGEAFIQLIFYRATKSIAATNVLTVILVVLLTSGCISELATTSRQLWAFSRDKAVPGHSIFSRISSTYPIPLWAISVSFVVSALLALINIGSTVALNAINSLASVSILASYFVTISTVIWRRLRGAPLPARRWSLGKLGLAVNVAAVCFLTPILFFDFWPLAIDPLNAVNLNWSPVMFVGVLVIASTYYVLKGRHEYTGPVVHVKRED